MKLNKTNNKNFILKEAVIAITYRCNSRCRMCNIWQKENHGDEIKVRDFFNLPARLKDINITGGEPFLREDLGEIIQAIKKRCPGAGIVISSNGLATDLVIRQVKSILKFDPNIGIAISIDGLGRAHDDVRGVQGAYGQAVETIQELKRIGVKNLKIAFTIGDYNYTELSGVYDLSKELRTEFSLAAVHSSKNYFGKENKIARKEEIAEQLDWLVGKELSGWDYKRWARAYFTYGLKEFLLTGKRILPDYSGKLNIFIDPCGDIYPCDVSGEKIGSLGKANKETKFSRGNLVSGECGNSWMICTARQAIKKHWFRAGRWILENKFLKI